MKAYQIRIKGFSQWVVIFGNGTYKVYLTLRNVGLDYPGINISDRILSDSDIKNLVEID